MLTRLDRMSYAVRQGARVAWYMGHYFAARRAHARAAASDGRPAQQPVRPTRPTPSRDRVLADMAELFRRDLANVEAGLYPLPADDDGGLLDTLRRSRRFFADLPAAAARRLERRGEEVARQQPMALPDYFVQNFHYQTGGYLTEESAELYDMQVEVLFNGSANAMRRQALVPLADYVRGRDQRRLRLLDVACGTGRFLRFVKEAFPRLHATGLDLSVPYLGEARRHLDGFSRTGFTVGNAEHLPVADASLDVVTTIYLFHEIPPEVRRRVAGEFARVLKPGGRLIFVDSIQYGDRESYDGMLEMFPVSFHEPFYDSYVEEDLDALFAAAGLVPVARDLAFLSKVAVYDKPAIA